MTERERLEASIAALQQGRSSLGDAAVDAALPVLLARLKAIDEAALPAPEQSLRLVSVLFTDVVDSVRLSQDLEPEDIQWVVDGALARFRDVVHRHGGQALQYAGDSMLAAFGVDGASEHDAERAIAAGLEIVAVADRHAADVRSRLRDVPFAVRVGIHAGQVLLGGGVDADGAIRGMAVNIAARLEQSAPPGTVRISHALYALARGVFNVTEEPPIALKGVATPIRSYLVHSAKPRAFRTRMPRIGGIETEMVGREVEIEQLREAFKRLCQESALRLVIVGGEAGVGKSRLQQEFQNWAELRPERFLLFHGRAHPDSQAQPYALLRDVLWSRLQIADDESVESAKAKLEGLLVTLFTETGDDRTAATAQAHVLGRLLGLDYSDSEHVGGIREDGRQIRNRGLHAAGQLFRRLAARERAPLVLLLEDLHWADEGSLEFLSYLAVVGRDVPMLIVGTARPLLHERRPAWPSPAPAERIELQPLDKGASRRLAIELLKGLDDVPAALRELVSSSADGNPFYMEELVRMLVDEGAIQTHVRPWRFDPNRLLRIDVPETLVGVLQARLDKLPARERLTLQQASVMGVVFWEDGLAMLDPEAAQAIPALLRRSLIQQRGEASSLQGREFVFGHPLLHRVTYETLLRQPRRAYHSRVARWLAEGESLRPQELLGSIAHHHDQAGEADAACEYFARASEDASARSAGDSVATYTTRALELLGDRTDAFAVATRWRLHSCRERLASVRGLRSDQQTALDAMRAIATAAGDGDRLAYVAFRQSDLEMRTGNYESSMRQARESMRLAEAAEDLGLKIRAQTRLAASLHYTGQADDALSLAREGLSLARAARLRKEEALCLNIISIVSLQGDTSASLEAEERQLEICRETGNASGAAVAVCNIGASLLIAGDLAQAEVRLREGLRLGEALGDTDIQPYPLLNLAAIAWRRHDDIQTAAFARAALEIATEAGSRLKQSGAHYWLGNAALGLGDFDGARAAFEAAWSIADSIHHAQRFDAAGGLVRVALAEGRPDAAGPQADLLLEHVLGGSSLNGADVPGLIHLTCFRLLSATGDGRATPLLAQVHAALLERAAKISDPARRRQFLALEENRAVLAAQAAQSAKSA